MQRSTQGNKNQQATQCIYSRPLLFVWALQFGAFREELDDTIMQWANQAKNNKRLEAVMIRLQEANVMLNGEKCKFLKVTIKFLGQLVGTYADPGTVPAVNHMAELTDVPDLWWFLEMLNHGGKYNPNMVELTYPLTELLSKKNTWVWGLS